MTKKVLFQWSIEVINCQVTYCILSLAKEDDPGLKDDLKSLPENEKSSFLGVSQ